MKRTAIDEISLFPFMDVLSGVVGILILIITALTALGISSAKTVIEYPMVHDRPRPIYVECRQDHLIIHPEKVVIESDDLKNSSPWQECLRRCASRGKTSEAVVLLVRDDGFETYERAEYSLQQAGGNYGFDFLLGKNELVIRPAVAKK